MTDAVMTNHFNWLHILESLIFASPKPISLAEIKALLEDQIAVDEIADIFHASESYWKRPLLVA